MKYLLIPKQDIEKLEEAREHFWNEEEKTSWRTMTQSLTSMIFSITHKRYEIVKK